MTVLVTGGGGYIGSHMVKRLVEDDEDLLVLDDFSTGFPDAVIGGRVFEGSFGDYDLIKRICLSNSIDVAMVFSSFIEVGESVENPLKYYVNNVNNLNNLLSGLAECGVSNIVFSSSAAVYGACGEQRLTEDHPHSPVSPYGRTKSMIEQILTDCSQAYGLSFYAFRYFNAAGADPSGRLGERHDPETHLIPIVLQAASGRRPAVQIFGRDYLTPDGTCVRDFMHVEDIVEAHMLAMRSLRQGSRGGFYNLGSDAGYSVKEVIDIAREVTGRDIRAIDAPARQGDPAFLVADATKARQELGWRARYDNLETIIEHAWRWELQKGKLW